MSLFFGVSKGTRWADAPCRVNRRQNTSRIICIRTESSLPVCVYIYICMCMCMYMWVLYARMWCAYVYVCVYVYMHYIACMCYLNTRHLAKRYTYTCTYICVYIHMYMYKRMASIFYKGQWQSCKYRWHIHI